MKSPVEAALIFDVGKTNKKCFLFSRAGKLLLETAFKIQEIEDEDGDPGEDLSALEQWIVHTIREVVENSRIYLRFINFSAYGATLVHLDRQGNPVCPVYNYLKAFPHTLFSQVSGILGDYPNWESETGSPGIGLINSGFQLYWLKYHKPEIYRRIRYSMHLPQYLSYLLTGIPVSDYASIGCHTAMWNYSKRDYHDWFTREKLDKTLPPLNYPFVNMRIHLGSQQVQIGPGIHDSSAALLAYRHFLHERFILVSTGTWCVTMNPDGREEQINKMEGGRLLYMLPDGKPVIAHRLFLGAELQYQEDLLMEKFKISRSAIRKIPYRKKWDIKYLDEAKGTVRFYFLTNGLMTESDISPDITVEEYYHRIIAALVREQVDSLGNVLGQTGIRRIIIDGGFTKNPIFLKMLARRMPDHKIYSSQSVMGPALGALMAVQDDWGSRKNLSHFMKLKRISP